MAEQRAEEIKAASELILLEMLQDITLSVTIAAHREIKRGRVVCGTCGKRCRSTDPLPTYPTPNSKPNPASRAASPFPPASQESVASTSAGPSSQTAPAGAAMLQVPSSTSLSGRNSSPAPMALAGTNGATGVRSGGYTVGPEKGTGGSTGVGSGSGRPDAQGNVFFDCLVCGRATASNRYAPHLSSCLGLSGSTRRGATRARPRAAAGAASTNGSGGLERSASPYVGGTPSEAGDSDDGASVSGKKTKSLGINNNGKRGPSPKKSAATMKKARLNASGTATPTTKPSAPSKLSQPPTTARPKQAYTRTIPLTSSSLAGSTYSASGSTSASAASGGSDGVPDGSEAGGTGLDPGAGQGQQARKTIPGFGGLVGKVPPPKSFAPADDSDDDWIR